jgi:hypothetical protein
MMAVSTMLIGLQREIVALTHFGMYSRTVSQTVPSTPHLLQVPLPYSIMRTFALQANVNDEPDTAN